MRTLILFIVLILPGLIFAEKLADLAEVMQPGDFHVYGDRIFNYTMLKMNINR